LLLLLGIIRATTEKVLDGLNLLSPPGYLLLLLRLRHHDVVLMHHLLLREHLELLLLRLRYDHDILWLYLSLLSDVVAHIVRIDFLSRQVLFVGDICELLVLGHLFLLLLHLFIFFELLSLKLCSLTLIEFDLLL
jgi:hypothetical protein